VPALPDLVSADSGRRRKALKDFKLGCGLASYLDADLIQVDSYYLPIHIDVPYDISRDFEYAYVAPSVRVDPDLDFWDYFNNVLVQSISECNDMAMGHGLKLCIEPRTWETISNVWAVELLMREVGSGNVGVVLDVAHLSAQKMNIVQCVEMLGSRIFYVHASDNDYLTEDHLEIGKGKVDWMNLLKALKKHSFSGFIGIDIGGKRELKPNLDEMYINSKRRLERMMKALAGSAEDK
jgi:sugar phosphate isomerase/epimerase